MSLPATVGSPNDAGKPVEVVEVQKTPEARAFENWQVWYSVFWQMRWQLNCAAAGGIWWFIFWRASFVSRFFFVAALPAHCHRVMSSSGECRGETRSGLSRGMLAFRGTVVPWALTSDIRRSSRNNLLLVRSGRSTRRCKGPALAGIDCDV